MRHGNRVDRSSRGVLTRWWGLGILSLAEVAPRWPLTFPEKMVLAQHHVVLERLAERIVLHREQYGPFRRVEHLMMVHGFSDHKFRALRELISVE